MKKFEVYYSKKFLFLHRYFIPTLGLLVTVYLLSKIFSPLSEESPFSKVILTLCILFSLLVTIVYAASYFRKEIASKKFLVSENGFTQLLGSEKIEVLWKDIAYYSWTTANLYSIVLKDERIFTFGASMKNASLFLTRMKAKGVSKS